MPADEASGDENGAWLSETLGVEVARAVNMGRTNPAGMVEAIQDEADYVDADGILQLEGWERGIKLREGSSGYEQAMAFAKQQEALDPLILSTGLERTARAAALRMASTGDLDSPHPLGIGLLQSARLHAKVTGLIVMNCSRGFFATGTSVMISWVVHDGDAERTHRQSIFRPEASYMGIGAAIGPDNRVYIAGIFADSAFDYDYDGNSRDVFRTLVAAYDVNQDGRLDHVEYSALCRDLGIEFEHDEEDFDLLCYHAEGDAHPGGLTAKGLASVVGSSLDGKGDTINGLVAARHAGKCVQQVSPHANPEKSSSQSAGITLTVDKPAMMRRIIAMWHAKDGDVIDELISNLKSPLQSPDAKLLVLSEVARTLHEQRGRYYKDKTSIDLLVMALYTMAGPDIDTCMGYAGVPVYDEGALGMWKEYTRIYTDRNKAMFSEVNWALRTAGADPEGDTEAWVAVGKWIKTICLLMALCARGALHGGDELSRGLAGLPDDVTAVHRCVRPGAPIDWAAPSSCALDAAVASAYIKGQAANATKGPGGSVLFSLSGMRQGIALQDISRYPAEAEILVSPLTSFRVSRRCADPGLPGTVCINMEPDSDPEFAALCEPFFNECLGEATSGAVPRIDKETVRLDQTIPQSLGDTLRPATRKYDGRFFDIMRRQLRGSSYGGGHSSLVGGGCYNTDHASEEESVRL